MILGASCDDWVRKPFQESIINSLNEAAKHIHQQSAQTTPVTKWRKWLGKTWRNVSTFMIDKSDFCYWSSQHRSQNGSWSLSLEEQRERLEQIYRDR